jgi:hypothetical protein
MEIFLLISFLALTLVIEVPVYLSLIESRLITSVIYAWHSVKFVMNLLLVYVFT